MSKVAQFIRSLSKEQKAEALGLLRTWEQEELEKKANGIVLNASEKKLCATGVSSDKISAIMALYRRLDIGLVLAKITVEKYCQDQKNLALQATHAKSVTFDISLT